VIPSENRLKRHDHALPHEVVRAEVTTAAPLVV
jgi:hypothetical protein